MTAFCLGLNVLSQLTQYKHGCVFRYVSRSQKKPKYDVTSDIWTKHLSKSSYYMQYQSGNQHDSAPKSATLKIKTYIQTDFAWVYFGWISGTIIT